MKPDLTQPITRGNPSVKIVKARDLAERDKYIESHELSMLSLLVRKYPKQTAEFIRQNVLDVNK